MGWIHVVKYNMMSLKQEEKLVHDPYLVQIYIKSLKLCQDKVYLFRNQMMNG